MAQSVKKYVVIGASHRALSMFIRPLCEQYGGVAKLVGIADINMSRAELMNKVTGRDTPLFHADDFDKMLDRQKPDVVIVATPDSSHDGYVIRALQRDLDVICEKPLTTDDAKCRAILAAEAASKGRVTVTFNNRYKPGFARVRELIQDGAVGRVVTMVLNWDLDTYHGSSYFMRWNRRLDTSGGLYVHKSTHHFDLVRWWLGEDPVEVFAYGGRDFYGPDGPRNPSKRDGRVCPRCDERAKCPYYMHWHRDEWRGQAKGEELDEHVSGAQQLDHYASENARRCIYDSEIDIADNYSAVVKFSGGATLAYSLNASCPREGCRVVINGMAGRIEYEDFVAGRSPVPLPEVSPIDYYPMFGGHERICPPKATGGHGGGDPLLRDELFIGPDPDCRVQRKAPVIDGVYSVLIGVAVRMSIAQGRPIRIADLLEG